MPCRLRHRWIEVAEGLFLSRSVLLLLVVVGAFHLYYMMQSGACLEALSLLCFVWSRAGGEGTGGCKAAAVANILLVLS